MTAGCSIPEDDSIPGLSSASPVDLCRFTGRLIVGLMLMAASAAHGANCNISVTGLNFGDYDPVSASPLDGATTLVVTCSSQSSTDKVGVTGSLSSGPGSYAARQMQGPVDTLNYNLYWDATRTTTIAGDGTAGTATVSDSLAAANGGNGKYIFTWTLYGRIPAGQDVGAGAYSTATPINITVSF